MPSRLSRKRTRPSRSTKRNIGFRSRRSRRSNRRPAGVTRKSRRVFKRKASARRLTTASVSRAICPINTYSFSLAAREVGNVASVGTLPCAYFTSVRFTNISLGYPNFTDVCGIGMTLTGSSSFDALTRTDDRGQAVASIDTAYTTFNYREKHTFTNVTNAQISLDCYYIVCRRDIPKYTATTAAGGFESYQLLDWLGAAFSRSTIDSLNTSGIETALPATMNPEFSSASTLMLDSQYEPSMAPYFNQYFRIRRTKRLKIGGGGIATVSNNVRRRITNAPGDYKNLLLNTSTWIYSDTGATTVWRKGSSLMLFRMHGQPVNSAATHAAVNYHTPELDHVTQVSFNYQAKLKRGSITYGGPSFGIFNLVSPDFVADDLDAVASIVTA